jgi:hypothetical protein
MYRLRLNHGGLIWFGAQGQMSQWFYGRKRGPFVDHRPRIARRIVLQGDCVLLMKSKATPKLEVDRRSVRKAYRRARKSALARLREGMDLRWTPPRSRDELHER